MDFNKVYTLIHKNIILIGTLKRRDNYDGYAFNFTPALNSTPIIMYCNIGEIGDLPVSEAELKNFIESTPEEIEYYYLVKNSKKYNL
jgi:hypothetical protein